MRMECVLIFERKKDNENCMLERIRKCVSVTAS